MIRENLQTSEQQRNSAYMAKAHPLRILLAEDNMVNEKVAVCYLQRLGYTVDVAHNGAEAVRALKRRTYDLIFMDVQMPELDGLQATGYIRKHLPAEIQPRIVALTAQAFHDDRDLCLNAGMDDYIAKPFRLEQLAAAIAKCPPQHRGLA